MKSPRFWSEDGALSRLLTPLAALWTLGGRARRVGTRPYQPRVPLICVGNATVGGTGKTPVVQALVADMIEIGQRPGILSRGYGGRLKGPVQVDPAHHESADVGDEPLLHAPLAPTVIARDRAAGARLLERLGVTVIVMDDGLQNASLSPSASLLVIDGATGFGNGRVLPAGPLREPVADAMSRVSAAVLLGRDRTGVGSEIPTDMPLFSALIEPLPDADLFRGKRVLAFAGIGRPEKLRETLADLGAEVVDLISFPDHHPYGADEIMTLIELAQRSDAALVTTTKDHVRLPEEARAVVKPLRVRLVWQSPDEVLRWLRHVLESSAMPPH